MCVESDKTETKIVAQVKTVSLASPLSAKFKLRLFYTRLLFHSQLCLTMFLEISHWLISRLLTLC